MVTPGWWDDRRHYKSFSNVHIIGKYMDSIRKEIRHYFTALTPQVTPEPCLAQ